MNRRALRTVGWLAGTALVLLGGGLSLALIKPVTTSLASKEYFKPDLHISTSNVRLSEMHEANPTAWNRFLSVYTDAEVFIDPRSGSPTSIVTHVPMIPGDGLDNRVTVQDLSASLERNVTEVDSAVVAGAVMHFIVQNQDVFAVDARQLGTPRADMITDQLWQISVPQMVDGVPVRYGRIGATISHGNLIVIGTESWGNVTISTKPAIDSEHALNIGFNHIGGEMFTDKMWMKPSLEIIPFAPDETRNGEGFAGPPGSGYGHRLAWTFGFIREGDDASWQISVDAQTGEVLEVKDANQYATKRVTGGVYPLTNTGICPDNARCGTMQQGYSMPFANTGFASPDNFTNSAGLYNYSSGTVATTLTGKFVTITDTCGAVNESSATGDLNLGGTNNQHDCTTGGASPGDTPASRSAFYEINKLKELARGWLPANAWLQAALQTNVNLTQTCNAFYSPTTGQVNFYRSGGGCRNTGEIAAVFDHEWGHGLDDNDTTGNLSNSSESYADITAIYRLQQACVGYGFWQTVNQGCGMTTDGTGFNGNNAQVTGQTDCELDCSGVRGADWDKHADHVPDTPTNFACPKCNSGSGPCGREVHCDAMIASESAWDFAARDLQAAPFNYDSTTAFALANRIFYQGSGNIGNWETCTCPSTSNGCGATNAYLQWAAADDDNGNLNDGTPHMTALFAAMNRHGMACNAPAAVNSGCAGAPTTAPTVTASPGNNQIVLNWGAVPGATSYWVLRSEGFAGCNFGKTRLANVVGTTYTDNGVANGTPYYYNVVAQGATEACSGPASTCLTATPQPCAGSISLNHTVYNCQDTVIVNLVDSDLIGAGTQAVTFRSTTETTPESLTLTENPANSGIFVGFFTTTPDPPASDGLLSVTNGDTLTVKYVDASFCGTPNVDVEQSAAVDCVGPVITNVHSQNVTGNSADIVWNTNEPANSSVTYDTVNPPTTNVTSTPAFVSGARTVKLTGLSACTTYFYGVSSTDTASNSTSDTNSNAYYSFATGVNVQPTYSYVGAPVPIPDNNPTGGTAIITVGDNKPIIDLDVRIDHLTHTFDGDLVVHIIGPDNTDVILSNRRGSSGDNFVNTRFDDASGSIIANGTAPFTGTFKPDNPLAAFNGKIAAGQWKLKVVDQANVDTGTIDQFSLLFTYPAQACGPHIEESAHTATPSCAGGSGGSLIDPGEDVSLSVTAHADGTGGVTGVSGVLSSSTPGVTVTQNTSTYPNLAADGSSPNTGPNYAFTVDSSVPCAASLDFQVQFTSNEGSWSDTFSLTMGSTPAVTNSYPSTDVPKVIADLQTVTSSVVVADTTTVSDVNVKNIGITHTFDGDLILTLISPVGTRVRLINRLGSSGDNFTNTVFDDEAATPIASGTPPYTGSFIPDQPLSAIDGQPANGTWKLEVQDAANVDTGTLNSWTLELTTQGARQCTNCSQSLPGEALNMQFPTKTTVTWSAAPNASFYNVYRGTAAGLPALLTGANDSCKRMTTGSLTGPVVGDIPPPDGIFWYLVRGANGSGEGTAGNATAGPRIQNSSGACP